MLDRKWKRVTSECRDELDAIKRALAANGRPATDVEAVMSALAAHAHFTTHPDAIVITREAMECAMLNYAAHAVERATGARHCPVANDDGTFSFVPMANEAH